PRIRTGAVVEETLCQNRSIKISEGADEMDLWYMIKERYVLLSVFLIIIFVSLLLLLATWKMRSNIPKRLTAITTTIFFIIILVSILALVFAVSFGYNA